MHHRWLYLFVTCAALAAGPHTAISASPVPQPVANVEIVVDGVVQRRYAHDGRWYIEALKGREYAIRLRNPYPVRVAVALSVDGLNTIDARETTANAARKWVIDPYGTITISGWQTSSTHARRFEFTTEERSHGQALGKTDNLGIICAVFFKERVQPIAAEARQGLPRAEPAPSASDAGKRAESVARTQTEKKQAYDYAATGMGGRVDHAVTQVWLDLEDKPAHMVNIRYEFRPQLVKLGILPRALPNDPLQRRERAQGFETEFAPEIP